jgi:hypothetical protein
MNVTVDHDTIKMLASGRATCRTGYLLITQGIVVFLALYFSGLFASYKWVTDLANMYAFLSLVFGIGQISRGKTIVEISSKIAISSQQVDAPEPASPAR